VPRAIDFHVHSSTAEWLGGSLGPMLDGTQKFFRTEVRIRSAEEMAAEYESWDLLGVLLAWDAETATGLPPLTNDRVAEICDTYPQWEPLWDKVEELGLPVIVHVGMTGLGACEPGGSGIAFEYGRPMYMDMVAARHPGLTVVMAHFGYPWHLEVISSALHKTNVWMDLSGWRPRYVPDEIKRDAATRLRDRTVWGSDYPMFDPGKMLEEIGDLRLGDAEEGVLRGNAARLLAVDLG